MKHVDYKNLQREMRDIYDQEIVMLHDAIPDTNTYRYALAVKIKSYDNPKGQMFLSDWWTEKDKGWKRKLDTCMMQIAGVMKAGWHLTGQKMDDGYGYLEPEYRCAYCSNRTTDPKGACICRRLSDTIITA